MSGSQLALLGGPFGAGAAGDPNWQNVALLSGTTSTNAGQNNTFLDSSSNNFTITRNGNTTQGTFTPFSAPNGYWGNSFDGNGDYLTVPYNANLALGTSDFTIEAWLYPNTLSAAQDPFGMHADSPGSSADIAWFMYVGANNSGNAITICNGTTDYAITGWSLTANVWQHVALTRSSGSLKFFINGVQVGSTVSANVNINNNAAWKTWIGTYTAASRPFNGYISNFRIVKGTAVYTSNFTPSTSPLTAISNTQLLTCQSNRFLDNSTNAFAITANGNTAVIPFQPFGAPIVPYSTSTIGGSGYFDGTGDYLETPSNSAFTLGSSGNFTVECWAYLNGNQSGSYAVLMTTFADFSSSYTNRWAFTVDGVSLRWYDSSGNVGISTNLKVYEWTHIAAVRNGSTITLYINGTSVGTQTSNQSYTIDGSVKIGYLPAAAYFNGYITDARVVKGTAVYTSNFTPPTAPLTAITNTSLLTNFTNANIYDQAAKNDMETVGNAQVSTSVFKYGTSSAYFDGSGDSLSRPNSPLYNFGAGDFTVECWVYIAANTSYATLIDFSNDAGGGYGWMLEYSSTRGVLFYMGTGGGNSNISYNFTPPLTTWTHVAVTRAGGYAKIFINGNQVAATSLTSSSVSTNPLVIGSSKNGTYPFNGYLSDVRITTGFARYTYNFTPPALALPNFYQAQAVPAADPYFNYTTLLLPGSGTNGAQNNTFLDSSTNAFSITRNGNTTQGTFSPFSQTGWSNYFSGKTPTAKTLISTPDSTALTLGSGDFTIECWVNPSISNSDTVIAGKGTVNNSYGDWCIYASPDPFFYASSNGANWQLNGLGIGTLPIGQWTHIAITRSGNTFRAFSNGLLVGTTTNSLTINDSNLDTTIGGGLTSGRDVSWNGYISNFRIVKGTAVYTASFTVPTTPLTAITNTSLLTCQSNRFVDNSTNAATLTLNGGVISVQAFSPFAPTATYSTSTVGGSGYFDGTGDYLTAASSSAFAMGTGDFCIEGWYYVYSNKNYNIYFDFRNGSNAVVPYVYSDSTGYIDYYVNGASRITGNSIIKQNEWTHIAVIRSGSSTKLFVNGAQVGSTYTDNNNYVQGPLYVGRNNGGGTTFDASYYCSGFRVVKGTTGGYGTPGSTITVPSSPKTSDANTSVLLNFTNAGITDATAENDLETVGNAQISNGQAKWGSTSIAFDGTGDYLTVRSGPWLQMSSDFTLECWIYPTSSASNQFIFSAVDYWRNSLGLQLLTNRTIKFVMCDVESSSGVYDEVTTSSTVSLNTWTHIAVARYGGTLSVYINGLNGGSTSSTRINYIPTGLTAIASDGGSYLNSSLFTGYIQDLRITKGIARYTQNFPVPTAAFQLL